MSQDHNHLNHTTWECKYHVVFTPKYRKKLLFGQIRRHLGSGCAANPYTSASIVRSSGSTSFVPADLGSNACQFARTWSDKAEMPRLRDDVVFGLTALCCGAAASN